MSIICSSSHDLSVGITDDSPEIFPTYYAKMKPEFRLVTDMPYELAYYGFLRK